MFTSLLHVHINVCLLSGQGTKLAGTRGNLFLCIYRAYPIGREKRKQITCSPKTEIFHFYQGIMNFFWSHVRSIGSRNLFRVLYFLEARYIALTTVYFRGNFQAIFDDEIKYNNRQDFGLFVT